MEEVLVLVRLRTRNNSFLYPFRVHCWDKQQALTIARIHLQQLVGQAETEKE